MTCSFGTTVSNSRVWREPRRLMPTTRAFAALHDHTRLPWRFFGRLTASAMAGLAAR